MNKKIVIGIPSYNEADTIGYIVRQVDLGLKRFYPAFKCLIINVDSDSKDNTKEAFLKTPTFFPKEYLNVRKKPRGKGRNLMELFKYCAELSVDFIAILDSDIKTVEPEWVFSSLNPLIIGKFDYTTPVYARRCYDGNVTNNFAFPLTYAVFGVSLQQPIGGEFGLNKRFYRHLLKQPISDSVLGFGIDIFITYHALGGGFKVCEAYLGRKEHKPGFPTLMVKFSQISQSAIEVSRSYINKLDKVKPVKECKNIQIFKTKRRPNGKLVLAQLHHFSQNFKNSLSEYYNYLGKKLTDKIVQVMKIKQTPALSSTLWTEALARFLNICYAKNFEVKSLPEVCRLIAPIFYWRVISFWEEMKDLTPAEIDKKIRNQAELLRKKIIERI